MSFKVLGPTKECSQADKAWRRLTREHRSGKSRSVNAGSIMKELNTAKMQCLEAITQRDYLVPEQEFVRHMCRKVESKLVNDYNFHIDLGEEGLIRPKLRDFFQIRTIDAMMWTVWCVNEDAAFDQEIEDEIPILCRFYNDYIGEAAWSEHDHTMMMVLNKYTEIKTGGYGNFAPFRE